LTKDVVFICFSAKGQKASALLRSLQGRLWRRGSGCILRGR